MPQFFVFLSPVALTLTFELGRDFCTVHLIAKFHRPTFNRSEVIVLTNKQKNRQTDAAENIHLAALCYAGGCHAMTSSVSRVNQNAVLSKQVRLSVLPSRSDSTDQRAVNVAWQRRSSYKVSGETQMG